MKIIKLTLNGIALFVVLVATGWQAHAQSTRTWVSGVGDDANPCSRTAPCKTFAGAISKTAAGGEINVIDAGGFGALTITKSITIDGGGTFASVVAAGTNGIVINAAATAVVTIRNLSINGVGTGLNGIRFLAGASLNLENVQIFGFSQKGIDFEPAGAAQLNVRDSEIRNNTNSANGGGILVKPGVSGSVNGSLDNVRLDRNTFGIRVEDRSTVTVRNSVVAGNTNNGFLAISTGASAVLNLESCVASGTLNVTSNGAGIQSNGSQALVRITNVTSVGNNIGLLSAGAGSIISLGNNRVLGNTASDGAPTLTVGQV